MNDKDVLPICICYKVFAPDHELPLRIDVSYPQRQASFKKLLLLVNCDALSIVVTRPCHEEGFTLHVN